MTFHYFEHLLSSHLYIFSRKIAGFLVGLLKRFSYLFAGLQHHQA